MRDLYQEYRQGLIRWDEAYFTANNLAAAASDNPKLSFDETDYWARQMESLGVDAAEKLMGLLGYRQADNGVFFKIKTSNSDSNKY